MSSRLRVSLAAGVIILAGLAAYANSFRGAFVFDDDDNVRDNPTIRRLWPIGPVLGSLGGGQAVQGRPVLNLSFAVNYAIDGTEVAGYHVANLAIHLLAALALFGVVRRTLLLPSLRDRFGDASTGLALASALLWLVHPLQTESVTYITQRAESLVGLWYLLTLYCCIRGFDAPRPIGWYVAAASACLLGMASKEVMISAPLIVLLYDRVFVAPTFKEALRRRWGLYVALFATCGLLVMLATQSSDRGGSAGFGHGISSWDYAMTQLGAIVHYVRLCFWPDPLVIHYGDAVATQASQIVPYAVVIALALAGVVVALRYQPWIFFLGAWFFAILAPSSSIIPVVSQTTAEHRMYLPLAAVVVLVVMTAYALWSRLAARLADKRWTAFRRAAPAVVLALAAAALIWRTAVRNEDYRSEVSIWQATVDKVPENPRAHYNLAVALVWAGKNPEAIEHLRQALVLRPGYAGAHFNLGLALVRTGQIDEAIEHYRQALKLKPDYPEAHNSLGNALVRIGRVSEAIGEYEQALRLKPDYPEAHYNLALALTAEGRIPEAVAHYEAAIRLNPDHAKAHANLGVILARQGRIDEAIEHFKTALRIRPDMVEARKSLQALEEMRRGR